MQKQLSKYTQSTVAQHAR